MLASALGVRLVLWVGPTVPVPAPYPLTSAISKVEVQNSDDGADGFQVTFSLGRNSPEYQLLKDNVLAPYNRVTIGVLMGAIPHVLINGVILNHQVSPGADPGTTSLTVMGRDVSHLMDLQERTASFVYETDGAYVQRVIGQYADLRITTEGVTVLGNANDKEQWQSETDLVCIQRLAERNGFDFYIEPTTFLLNRAYFGPRQRVAPYLPPLTFNMGDATNVTSLSFSEDANAPLSTELKFMAPDGKTIITLPPMTLPKVPPFAQRPLKAMRNHVLREGANLDPSEASLRALARVNEAPDAVTGEGQVDVLRYGSVMRARRLVAVRGAGHAYNGTYLVRRVSHSIERGRYTQSFSISREGTGNLLPRV
jgi:hypothetical protein